MKHLVLCVLSSVLLLACTNPDDKSINIFSIQDDIQLGAQMDSQILANPEVYPLLSETRYPEAHKYVRGLIDTILNSGIVFYSDEFEWKTRIIQDDSTLNAFCTPGGYIYVYTGLMKFLNAEHELLGVLAHEVAHADRRHSTDQLTKQYGISTLVAIILGENQNLLADIAVNLINLRFSRNDEREADEYSVRYLCPTTYPADGSAAFFQKLDGANTPPEFLSTHPNPDNRVEAIQGKSDELMCLGNQTYQERYQAFIRTLP